MRKLFQNEVKYRYSKTKWTIPWSLLLSPRIEFGRIWNRPGNLVVSIFWVRFFRYFLWIKFLLYYLYITKALACPMDICFSTASCLYYLHESVCLYHCYSSQWESRQQSIVIWIQRLEFFFIRFKFKSVWLCVCVIVCVGVCVCVCVCVPVYECVCGCVSLCVCEYVWVCSCFCVRVSVWVCLWLSVEGMR